MKKKAYEKPIRKRFQKTAGRISYIAPLLALSAALLFSDGCGSEFDGKNVISAAYGNSGGQIRSPAVIGRPISGTEFSEEYEGSSLTTEFFAEDTAMNDFLETNGAAAAGTCLPSPGVKTLKNFLLTALLPLGNTMYVWGGGWNEEDTGAGAEAVSLGVSPRWKDFADLQTDAYDYRKTRYQIHDGLDCSGYVGWVVYNTMEAEGGGEGYVFKSTDTAELYAENGWGDFSPASQVDSWLAGDIMSMNGHVWICLGSCGDGSILLIHSSPPGVRLCGTEGTEDKASQAVSLAEEYMSLHCPEWYRKYPCCQVTSSYLKDSGQMRWNVETFPDADELRSLTPEELLRVLFSEPASDQSLLMPEL